MLVVFLRTFGRGRPPTLATTGIELRVDFSMQGLFCKANERRGIVGSRASDRVQTDWIRSVMVNPPATLSVVGSKIRAQDLATYHSHPSHRIGLQRLQLNILIETIAVGINGPGFTHQFHNTSRRRHDGRDGASTGLTETQSPMPQNPINTLLLDARQKVRRGEGVLLTGAARSSLRAVSRVTRRSSQCRRGITPSTAVIPGRGCHGYFRLSPQRPLTNF
jgi:hypothetical protein